jgi:hypothetical protein
MEQVFFISKAILLFFQEHYFWGQGTTELILSTEQKKQSLIEAGGREIVTMSHAAQTSIYHSFSYMSQEPPLNLKTSSC